jgi:hypothetical protein
MAPSQEDEGTPTGETGVLSRHPTAFAVGGGLAAAFGSSFIPMTAIEGFVTAYGIAELLPAAAPPLGETARLALSTGIGTLTAGALLALLPRAETEDMGFEATVKKAGSTAPDAATGDAAVGKGSKLAGWLRTLRFGKSEPAEGTVTDFADINRLRIRNGDQHPDAPARAPIRASSDLAEPQAFSLPVAEAPAAAPLELGEDMAFAPAVPSVDERAALPVQAPSVRFAPPALAEPEVEADIPQTPVPAIDTVAEAEFVDHEEDVAPEIAPETDADDTATVTGTAEAPFALVAEDLDALSVSALLERLEAGLARRRAAGQAVLANGSPSIEPTARLFSLAKPPSLPGDVSVDEQPAQADERPLRFRVEQPAMVEAESTIEDLSELGGTENKAPPEDVWTSVVEYQPPAIGGYENDTAHTIEPAAELEAQAQADDAPVPRSEPIDDDMDAALRDALATLRQLSDRQRNS